MLGTSALGSVALGNIPEYITEAADLTWLPGYPSRINRKQVNVFQLYDRVGNLSIIPITDLSWQGEYVDAIAKKKRQLQSFTVGPLITPTAAPVTPLSWAAEYPDTINRKKLRTATIPSSDVRNFVPILKPVPTFFGAENIRPFKKKPFWGYQYTALVPFFTDTPIPFCPNRKLIANVNLTETWESHFVSHGWTTIQDQINAGYPIYCQPTLTSGSYEEVYDAGVTINNTVITFSYSTTAIVGVINVVVKLAISTDGVTFTPFNVGNTLFATAVRYVKFRLEFTTTGDHNVATYYTLNLNLSTKREMDGGTVNVLAADTGGTVVTFNKAFKDVETITVTPLATVQQSAIYDFVDIPNPVSFKILLYDAAGTRIDGTVSWKARGVV